MRLKINAIEMVYGDASGTTISGDWRPPAADLLGALRHA
jgi:hypothetical protein